MAIVIDHLIRIGKSFSSRGRDNSELATTSPPFSPSNTSTSSPIVQLMTLARIFPLSTTKILLTPKKLV
jgi:hypothetical protein